MTTQMSLQLQRMQPVDIEQVRRQPSLTKAIVLCADLGGFANDKDLCRALDIDPPVWARIKQGDANFPHEKYESLFNECGNDVPLIWLADRRGYELVHLESELERQLRGEREARATVEAENKLLKGLLIGRTETK